MTSREPKGNRVSIRTSDNSIGITPTNVADVIMVNLNRMNFNEHDRLPKYSPRVRIPLPALNSGSYTKHDHFSRLLTLILIQIANGYLGYNKSIHRYIYLIIHICNNKKRESNESNSEISNLWKIYVTHRS